MTSRKECETDTVGPPKDMNHFGYLRLCSSLQIFNCSSNALGIVVTIFPSPESHRTCFPSFIRASSVSVRRNSRYFCASNSSKAIGLCKVTLALLVFEHYTGVGETIAVHELDPVFNLMHTEIRVKRGSLLEFDDAKNNNLIFVGSPLENLSLLEIPGTQDFVFNRIESGPRKGDPGIVNVHPQPGEPKEFFVNPHNGEVTEDHAVIALPPGMSPGQSILVLAGNTTMGTQAAAEYVCRPDSVNTLLRRILGAENGNVKPFEAVIHVKVGRGVPLSSELVALHTGTP